MTVYKDFKLYRTRARTIQNLIKFHTVKLSDHQLSKFVEFGMIEELQTAVDLWDLTKPRPDFKYQEFKQKCIKLYDSMVTLKQITRKVKTSTSPISRPTSSNPRPASSIPRLSDEEFVWKIHSYLDLVGKCHFCKGYCGSAHPKCKGPYRREKIIFPAGYVAPPKPDKYVPPKAKTSAPTAQAGRPTQLPAGRPNTVKVAATTEFPALDKASIAALEDLDAELAEGDEWVPPAKIPRITVDLLCNGHLLRALADPGSEINLLGDHLVDKLGLQRRKLHKPTNLGLAVSTTGAAPTLTHFTTANLTDPSSRRTFNRTYLKLGQLDESCGYDSILGTPFFHIFRMSVSVSQRAMVSEVDGKKIFDATFLRTMRDQLTRSDVSTPETQPVLSPMPSSAALSLGEERERQVLEEFQDLFPADIPAVSEEAEAEGDFTDGSFPAKM